MLLWVSSLFWPVVQNCGKPVEKITAVERSFVRIPKIAVCQEGQRQIAFQERIVF
jgi:hypothetical protein